MPLVMNGVIIPENVANAFYFNGVNITDVFMNGVQVWNQSLFSALWSGSSYGTYNGTYGLQTSGSQFRSYDSYNGVGVWLTVSLSGFPNGTTNNGSGFTGFGFKSTTSNTLQVTTKDGVASGTLVSFTIGSGFSLVSTTDSIMSLETSGGLLRVTQKKSVAGAWISLT